MEDYERQRMLRIEENRAKFEALGLPSLASAVLNSSRSSAPQGQSENDSEMGHRKRRCRGIGGSNDDGDDDYRPSDGSEGFSSSDGDAEEEEEKTNYKVISFITSSPLIFFFKFPRSMFGLYSLPTKLVSNMRKFIVFFTINIGNSSLLITNY